MRTVTVNIPRLTLTVLQGSTVILDEAQYNLVKQFVSAEPERTIITSGETPEQPVKRARKTKIKE